MMTSEFQHNSVSQFSIFKNKSAEIILKLERIKKNKITGYKQLIVIDQN